MEALKFDKMNYSVDLESVPFEMVKIIHSILTHYLDLTNERFEKFKGKILEIRLREINLRKNKKGERWNSIDSNDA